MITFYFKSFLERFDVAKVLIEHRGIVDAEQGVQKESIGGESSKCRRDLNIKDNAGNTALFEAARRGNLHSIKNCNTQREQNATQTKNAIHKKERKNILKNDEREKKRIHRYFRYFFMYCILLLSCYSLFSSLLCLQFIL